VIQSCAPPLNWASGQGGFEFARRERDLSTLGYLVSVIKGIACGRPSETGLNSHRFNRHGTGYGELPGVRHLTSARNDASAAV
jgi:hypothetical protein